MASNKKLLAELQRRAEIADPLSKFKIEDFCFNKQMSFISDTAKFKTGVCSRRAGKTVACAADLIYTALSQKGDVAYITLNRRSAKKIIWRQLLDIIKEFKIACKVDNTDLTITLSSNGNMIHVSGAKDESEIEKFRGIALRKIYIDECQSFRSYIKTFIEDILENTLTDYDGSLILIGTPGPIPAGYFYDASHSSQWSHHKWTMHDNPHLQIKSGKTAAQIIEERCLRRGVTIKDPGIRREYFGEWMQDSDSLVFKFDKIKNVVMKAPEPLEYIFGVDLGFDDSDAIAVLGYSYREKNVYLVEEYVMNQRNITSLMEKIEDFRSKYKPVKIVMDTGGLGKKIAEELRSRHSQPIHAAEKSRKFEYIELLNDDLRTGKFKAIPNTRFQEDAFKVEWDRSVYDKLKISDSYHSDITDAVLYAWRECKHYFYKPEEAVPTRNSNEYMDKLEQKEAQKLLESKGKEWWDELDPDEDEKETIEDWGSFDE